MMNLKKIAAAAAMLACVCAPAFAGVKFEHRFNPVANKVNELEKPARAEICLNGSWDFMPVYSNKKDDFKVPAEFKADDVKIKIPSPWNINRFAMNNVQGGDFNAYPSYPEKWKDAKIGWQRRDFEIPASWAGKRIILRFDGVMGNCEVYVNGQKAAENFDMFMPFEADITKLVKAGGKNEILVGVAKAELYNNQGKFGRIEYMGGSFWGEFVSGIWQDVYLLAKPEVYVKDAFVKPDVKNSTLTVEVEVKNETNSPKKVSLGGDVRKWKNLAGSSVEEAPEEKGAYEKDPVLKFAAKEAAIPANSSATIALEIKDVKNLEFWTPEAPNLYGAVIALKADKPDVKVQRFGWRQFSIDGKDLLLNGKKYELRGDSWHFMGVPQMTRRYAWSLFKMMKDANINAVRFHAQPYPEFYLDVADEFGVCVLDESAIWASGGAPKYDSDLFMQRCQDHIERFVKRDRNHPSVFGWSVCNEVLAVAIHVFKSPEELVDRVIDNMNLWVELCRKFDPTRDWISGDGETNREAKTKFPTSMGHYANIDHMSKKSVPWGIGEQTMAYYGTPLQASKYNGDRAYESMLGRMEAIAIETYRDLKNQREKGAAYACVFNIAWYGLKPLALGMPDTSKAPTLEDGVFFPKFKEGEYGMQPERLGPYTTTLNPAYDKSLPLYEPWPMFYAAKAANATPMQPFEIKYPEPEHDAEPMPAAAAAELAASENSPLAVQLRAAGLVSKKIKAFNKNALMIVDGSQKIENFEDVKKAIKGNAKVVVLGICPESAEQLNSVLGKKNEIELQERKATSFVKKSNSPMLAGLTHKDLYFSELLPNNKAAMKYGISGAFAKNAKLLAGACNTDWQQWNKRAEYAKTGAVIRSEREAKGSGNAIMSLQNKKGGEIVISTIDFSPIANETSKLVSQMLANLGATFSDSKADEVKALDESGALHRIIANGKPATAKNGKIDLPASCREFSFWVYSPRSLVDLLAEPNMPVLDMVSEGKAELMLNGKNMAERSKDSKTFSVLPLDKGWNKFTVKTDGSRGVKIRFECKNQPKFMKELLSSIENRK